jgi:4-cresol dehydrogenase (hydroxylating) flavoprotein subunit
MSELGKALDAWREAIGTRHVITGSRSLNSAAAATFPTSQRVAAILRPGRTADVQACLRVAGVHRVPVYPLSTGKNWGYGSRVPPRDGSVLMELSRMNRILAYDEDLAYVTVEPGVTQAQLAEHLRDRRSRLWMDATGSTPLASVLGNTVERGFGVTPYGDHMGWACGLEVVLPDGALLRTGWLAFPGSKVESLDSWPPGPQLEGLFSQSGLGVVTKLSLPLMPAPQTTATALFDLDGPEELERAVDAMRRLQLEGTVRAAPWFGNSFRLLATVMRYPWNEGLPPPLTRAQGVALAARYGIAPWTGAVGLYGTAAQVAANGRRLREVVRPFVRRLRLVDPASLARANVSARRGIELGLHRGYTGQLMNAVRRAYWRKHQPPSAEPDLDQDRVGFLFANAAIPFAGADVVAATGLVEEVVTTHGFEPAVNCHSVRQRVLQLIVSICYDREVEGEDERVIACSDELNARLADAGYYPFRLGIHTMGVLDRADPTYLETLRSLKRLFDPEGILAPGRYEPA